MLVPVGRGNLQCLDRIKRKYGEIDGIWHKLPGSWERRVSICWRYAYYAHDETGLTQFEFPHTDSERWGMDKQWNLYVDGGEVWPQAMVPKHYNRLTHQHVVYDEQLKHVAYDEQVNGHLSDFEMLWRRCFPIDCLWLGEMIPLMRCSRRTRLYINETIRKNPVVLQHALTASFPQVAFKYVVGLMVHVPASSRFNADLVKFLRRIQVSQLASFELRTLTTIKYRMPPRLSPSLA